MTCYGCRLLFWINKVRITQNKIQHKAKTATKRHRRGLSDNERREQFYNV